VGLLFFAFGRRVGLVLHGLPKIQNPTGWMRGADVPGMAASVGWRFLSSVAVWRLS
jgi:hypothetical protein